MTTQTTHEGRWRQVQRSFRPLNQRFAVVERTEDIMHDEGRDESHCVLCGKEIKKLILGVRGGVCVNCVYLCLELIQQEKAQSPAQVEINREVVSMTETTFTGATPPAVF